MLKAPCAKTKGPYPSWLCVMEV